MNTALNHEPHIVGHRFVVLGELGRGGMGVVYRAMDRLTGEHVAIKQVVPSQMGIDVSDSAETINKEELRLALTREFKALATLRHPNIISVLDYGFDDTGSSYFAMELLQNPQSLLDVGSDASTEARVDLLIQMLQALNYLHRYGILHRDMKPQNVLVVDGQVKVLDFGLAVLREHSNSSESSGTLAYMAPEVLMGSPASEASDLYAVGVMAYELFAGRHPFDTKSMTRMITDVINTRPDVSELSLSDDLQTMLERLLEKDPGQRYRAANEVIDILRPYASQPLAVETSAIRDSFLKAARFVARETDLTPLTQELERTLSGRGNAWLIGGESGVGKSRLLDELRIHALVKGFHVFRGQEVSEGGNPFEPWREVLRRMCLHVSLNNTQASILKPLVPDLSNLLQRDIPDAPTLEAGAAQDRLFLTVEDVFRRHHHPALVILEDLQWADSATLLLLSRLHRLTIAQPLFIMGSYRHDERPTLADNLPIFQVTKLERFDERGIEQLAVSMLGEVGLQKKILKLLKEESGGNPFFVVEVVRALAEISGQLDKIGTMTLPKQIFPGGVHDIIQHRLKRVPADALPLLQLAAVMGRQLDIAVLQVAQPDLDLDFWLASCASLAILEVEDDHWRFSQNKLRDGILSSLSADEVRTCHHQAAQAIEHVYPDGAGWLAILALHWEMAGDTAKASAWYERAGYEAESAYTPENAIAYYEKALAFLPQDDQTVTRQIAINRGLGKMLRWQARYDDATQAYIAMRTAAESRGDTLSQVQAWIGLCEVDDRRGDRKSALAHVEHAETLARSLGKDGEVELADALGSKAWSLNRLKNREAAAVAAKEALEISTRLNIQSGIARNESVLGVISTATGRFDEAIAHMLKALMIARELGDKRDIGIRLNNLAEVNKMRGTYPDALQFFEEALAIFQEIGYRDAELAVLTNLGSVRIILEDYVRAELHLRTALELNNGNEWWGLSEAYRCLGEVILRQGLATEALADAKLALSEGKKSEISEFIGKAWRVLGMALGRSSDELVLDEVTYSPRDCFGESLKVFKADGAEVEEAYSLWAWASYEIEHNNEARGRVLWQDAIDLFTRNHFTYEVDKMTNLTHL